MRRIAFIASGRYDWTRCQTVIEALSQRDDVLEPIVFTCGAFRDQCEVPPNVVAVNLPVISELSQSPHTMARSYSILCEQLTSNFDRYKPDIVVAMTDRYEALAAASVAALTAASTRCAYRSVIDAVLWPTAAPMLFKLAPAAAPWVMWECLTTCQPWFLGSSFAARSGPSASRVLPRYLCMSQSLKRLPSQEP